MGVLGDQALECLQAKEGPKGGGRRWAGAPELGVGAASAGLQSALRILGAVLGRMVAEEGLWRRDSRQASHQRPVKRSPERAPFGPTEPF